MYFTEFAEKFADFFLPLFPGFNFLQPYLLVLLVASREIFEAAFLFQLCNPFFRCLEVQSQRALDRDLVEAEVRILEDFTDDERLFLSVDCESPCFAIEEVTEDPRNLADLTGSFSSLSPILLRLLPRLLRIFT